MSVLQFALPAFGLHAVFVRFLTVELYIVYVGTVRIIRLKLGDYLSSLVHVQCSFLVMLLSDFTAFTATSSHVIKYA